MKFGQIENPENFFYQLGCLHETRVESFKWVPPERKVLIKIDDLNSNFLDLPEYEGLLPATLVFSNVKKMMIGVCMLLLEDTCLTSCVWIKIGLKKILQNFFR